MLSTSIPRTRILHIRPPRPPSATLKLHVSPPARVLHSSSRRSLARRISTRPQLPYLSQPLNRSHPSLLGPNPQLARLLSTENRRYISEQVYLAAKWTGIFWVFAALLSISYFGVQLELEERRAPTPEEWGWRARTALRTARKQLRAGEEGAGMVDWVYVGGLLRSCLKGVERDLPSVAEEDGGIVVDGVGKAGLDVSGKSWPWVSGYFEVLMGCAAAAERLEGTVLDKRQKAVFLAEQVVGPSNPDPRPLPVASQAQRPREEDCEPAFEPPETYYMRILTSKGFTTKQKLDAAWAFANWLEFKGLNKSAEEMYRWGIDIAKGGMELLPADSYKIVDSKTAVLHPDMGDKVSENLFRATTALAIHHARAGNPSAALPILLSILRARRATAVVQSGATPRSQPEPEATSKAILSSIFTPPHFPPPPPSGDTPALRTTDKPTCEESELMLYIGEILFATSSKPTEGLAWTRQAVTVAEANLSPDTAKPRDSAGMNLEERTKCRSCVSTGINNWETMLRRLSEQRERLKDREGGESAGWLEWRGWFGRDGGVKGKTLGELKGGVIEEELKKVETLKERLRREGAEEEMRRVGASRGQGMGLWLGGG